jgi:hypothetical protein
MRSRKDLTQARKAIIINEIAIGNTTKAIFEIFNLHVVTATRVE